jgi:PHP family Zn ribbon phosphoesterase
MEEYSMVLPDSSLYKDFNSETDFVDHKMDNIEVYLKPMEMTIVAEIVIVTFTVSIFC